MSIQRNYCKAVAAELNRHAVWQPGGPANIGDYGLIENAEFLKLGNIDQFQLDEKPRIDRSTPSNLEFTSAGTKVVLLDSRAKMNTPIHVAPVTTTAELRITFNHANSIYLRASKVVTEEIANAETVAYLLRNVEHWDFRWVIVSKVTTASHLSLILSAGDRSEVSVHATADVLKAFDSGSASAKLGFAIAGDAALKIVGASGPLLFDLIRLRRILGGIRRAANPGGLAVKPYEVVSAGEPDAAVPTSFEPASIR